MKPLFKTPISVLVVICTEQQEVLLLERQHNRGFWQSVTGSLEANESLEEAAYREVFEETGLDITDKLINWHRNDVFDIFPQWRHRYAPEVSQNTEHVFSAQLSSRQIIRLAPEEHADYLWLPWQQASKQCFSWTNQQAIEDLPKFYPAWASNA